MHANSEVSPTPRTRYLERRTDARDSKGSLGWIYTRLPTYLISTTFQEAYLSAETKPRARVLGRACTYRYRPPGGVYFRVPLGWQQLEPKGGWTWDVAAQVPT